MPADGLRQCTASCMCSPRRGASPMHCHGFGRWQGPQGRHCTGRLDSRAQMEPPNSRSLPTWTSHSRLEQILIGVVVWAGASLGCRGTCSWVAIPAAATHMHPAFMSAAWMACQSGAWLCFSASLLCG